MLVGFTFQQSTVNALNYTQLVKFTSTFFSKISNLTYEEFYEGLKMRPCLQYLQSSATLRTIIDSANEREVSVSAIKSEAIKLIRSSHALLSRLVSFVRLGPLFFFLCIFARADYWPKQGSRKAQLGSPGIQGVLDLSLMNTSRISLFREAVKKHNIL